MKVVTIFLLIVSVMLVSFVEASDDFQAVDIISPVVMKGVSGKSRIQTTNEVDSVSVTSKVGEGSLQLPVANDSPVLKVQDNMIVVDVSSQGWLCLADTVISRAELRKVLKVRYRKQGKFPIFIRGDKRATHKHISAVLDIAAESGLWQVSVVGIKKDKASGKDIPVHLEISRFAPDPDTNVNEQIQDILSILVYNKARLGGEGYVLKGRKVSYNELDRQLTRLHSFSDKITVIIKCTNDSPHDNLVKLLNLLSGVGFKNVKVFSM